MQPQRSTHFEKSISLNLRGCAEAANLLRIITYGIYFYILFQLIIMRPFNFISFTILLMFPLGMLLSRYSLFSRLPRQLKNFMPYFLVGVLFLANWLLALLTQSQIPPPDSSSATLFLVLFFFHLMELISKNRSRKIEKESGQLGREDLE